MKIITKPKDPAMLKNIQPGLHLSRQKYLLSEKKNHHRHSRGSSISQDLIDHEPVEILEKASTHTTSSSSVGNHRHLKRNFQSVPNSSPPRTPEDTKLKPLSLPAIGSSKISSGGQSSPHSLKPKYHLPKDLLLSHKNYFEISAEESEGEVLEMKSMLNNINDSEHPTKSNQIILGKLDDKFIVKSPRIGFSEPSKLIPIYVSEFCEEALRLVFGNKSLNYAEYQNDEDDLMDAFFRMVRDRGVLLRDLYPRLRGLRKHLVELIKIHGKTTLTLKLFYRLNRLLAIDKFTYPTIDKFTYPNGGEFLGKDLSVFILNCNAVEVPKNWSKAKSPEDGENLIKKIIVSVIGDGFYDHGLNVIELLKKYEFKDERGDSTYASIKRHCSMIAQLCYGEAKIPYRKYGCKIPHYYEGNGKSVPEISIIDKTSSTSSILIPSPRVLGDGLRPAYSDIGAKTGGASPITSLLNSFKFSGGHSPKGFSSPRNESSFEKLQKKTVTINPSAMPYSTNLFSSVKSSPLGYEIDLKGSHINLASYSINPIEDAFLSVKYDSLPRIITINGNIFYDKSPSTQSFSSKLKSKGGINGTDSLGKDIKIYASRVDFWIDFCNHLYNAGLVESKAQQRVIADVNTMEKYADRHELVKLGEHLNPPDLYQLLPVLKITDMMSQACTLRAIQYLSMLFPDFFPELNIKPCEFMIQYGNLFWLENLEHHIVINKDNYEVTQLNELKICHTTKKDEIVATLLYSWTNCPIKGGNAVNEISRKELVIDSSRMGKRVSPQKNDTSGYINRSKNEKGWVGKLTIEACNVRDPAHWSSIMNIVTKPKDVAANSELPGVEFFKLSNLKGS